MDAVGKYYVVNMMTPSIENPHGLNHAILAEFTIQEDDKMYIGLPDYYDFRCFGWPKSCDLAAISNRSYEGFPRPSRLTLKHHLIIMRMPKKSFKSIWGIPSVCKKGEFKQKRLFQRVGKISISNAFSEIAGRLL